MRLTGRDCAKPLDFIKPSLAIGRINVDVGLVEYKFNTKDAQWNTANSADQALWFLN